MLNFSNKTCTACYQLVLTLAFLSHQTGLVSSAGCRAGWLSRDGFCYRLVNPGDHAFDLHTGSQHCRTYGGHLVSIHSKAENTWLYNTFSPGYSGAYVLIGFHRQSGVWKWTDGSFVNYTNWYSGPSHPCSRIPLSSNIKKWTDGPCENKVAGYICKMEAEDLTPSLTYSNQYELSSGSVIPSSVFAVETHSLTDSAASFAIRCAVLCGRTFGCRGFNLNVTGETCVLLNINVDDESGARFVTPSDGTTEHYILTN